MTSSDTEKKQIYLEERSIYIELLKNSANQLDKYLLSFGLGAILLSITFIEKVVSKPQINTLNFLLFSWIFLLLSVISTLISFFTSSKACHKEIEILDQKYNAEEKEKIEESNKWSNTTNVLNIKSIIFLITGIFLLVLFSYKNIEYNAKVHHYNKKINIGELKMGKSKKDSRKEEKGLVPPKTSKVNKGSKPKKNSNSKKE